MSGFRGMMKDGWHPKGKDGGKESWRGDFKGIDQVAGWLGKGKDTSPREEHVSRPLSTLKDPSSFGPPPRRGVAAAPGRTTPDRRGLGAPLSDEQIEKQNARLEAEQYAQEQESERPPPPPRPYVADRSGLSTNNLPPPPVRRINSPAQSTTSASSRPTPRPPPRLPARRDTPSEPSTPPPAYSPTQEQDPESHGFINQHATSRLSQAGVAVPGLGIGGTNGGRGSAPSAPSRTAAPVNELQSRFSRMSTSSSTTGPETASTGHQDYSASESGTGRGVGSRISDFRERHSDHIDAGKKHFDTGKKKISDANEKYGVTKKINGKINGYLDRSGSDNSSAAPPPPPPAQNRPPVASPPSLGKKKPPLPPPPKKPGMRTTPMSPVNAQTPPPPPLPLGTKPR
ncbi:hypothetical protein NFIA_008670 [Paecilomyces variotii No. 5]|uniref:Uncharacterized protein n=1 Tax=Byssochlamys spectabilis (strain No. 5 / NBRC 109023) TaxID=1356009 RepID=V5HWQ1_BYSSN|nr:hypothetical protein NFIA_008670 [Paecilomyces variotii No. 5]